MDNSFRCFICTSLPAWVAGVKIADTGVDGLIKKKCLAMANNVYLTVFHKRTTAQLRKLEPLYIALCYGLPFLISLTFLLYRPEHKPRVYGEATLWCWISTEWQVLRIAAFYGPVWIVLAVTFGIYVMAGRVIFRMRRGLREFARGAAGGAGVRKVVKSGGMKMPEPVAVEMGGVRGGKKGGAARAEGERSTGYSCTISVGQGRGKELVPASRKRNAAVEGNTAAWAYCRCAMLFFLALVITWVRGSLGPSVFFRN